MRTYQEIVADRYEGKECRFVIEDSLRSEDIEGLKCQMLTAVNYYTKVSVVVSNLNELDLPALQWIMAFQRAAQTEGKEVSLKMKLNRSIRKQVEQSGLTTMFNCK